MNGLEATTMTHAMTLLFLSWMCASGLSTPGPWVGPSTLGLTGLTAPVPEDAEPPSRALLKELTAQARLAGTSGSTFGADVVARHLRAAGWQVEIDEREVVLSLPRAIEFAIYADAFADEPSTQRLERFDPDAIPPGDIPRCNAWSASGTVRALVVDAGHGQRADFQRLMKLGVDARGAIALVRYGRCYRGIKVDLATQFGCAAVLLFNDPAEDGVERGPAWPEGPWKPDWEAERGSISPIGHIPGDPSTPGWASPKPGDNGARRVLGKELDEALPRIPCIPIGSREAKLLIEKLAIVASQDDDGKAVEDHLGPGPVQARVSVDQPRDLRTIRNVIARLPGESPKAVIAGAHRDAWIRGANDDGAGTVLMLRAAQHLGEKARAGWKPRHTIMICLWDAEEFGMIGSTEWGEANAEWLSENAIAYVNADTGVSGPHFRGASGTPGLLGTLHDVLERLPAAPPASSDEGSAPRNLWEEWRAQVKSSKKDESAEPRLSLPGSGSDFAVFLHHLNLPVLQFGFGDSESGQYHTAFDDFAIVDRYIDPGFIGHEIAGKFAAELLSELSERGFGAFHAGEAARELARRAQEAADDCRKKASASEASPAGTDEDAGDPDPLAESLERVARSFEDMADGIDKESVSFVSSPGTGHGPGEARMRGDFYTLLAAQGGLPGRPWFNNRLWAPGLEDGYGSETFPTLRSAALVDQEALKKETDNLVGSVHGLLQTWFGR